MASTEPLQISGLLETAPESWLLKASPRSGCGGESGTWLLRHTGGETRVVGRFEADIKALLPGPQGSSYAVSAFGEVFRVEEDQIRPIADEPADPEAIFGTLVDGGRIFACCTMGRVMVFEEGAWTVLGEDVGGDELDTYGLCADGPDQWVCGEQGLLLRRRAGRFERVEVPTRQNLMAISRGPDGRLVVVGRKGTLLFSGEQGFRAGEPGTDRNLSDVVFWRDRCFVSANSEVLEIESGRLRERTAVPSFDLVATPSALWSIGLGTLHRFDGQVWTPVAIEADLG